MPFEKHLPNEPFEEAGGAYLLFVALLLALALFLGGLALHFYPKDERATVVGSLLEEDAVVAFLALENEE